MEWNIWMLIFFKNEIDKETSLVELYLYIECSEDFFFKERNTCCILFI